MTVSGQQILGAGQSALGTHTFHAVDPGTGGVVEPPIHEATVEEVDRAARLAQRDSDAVGRTSHADRARFLDAIAEEIHELGDTLIDRARSETGLPEGRLVGERGRTTGQLRLFAEVVREGSFVDARIDTAMPQRAPVPRPDIRSMMRPLGPVAVFGASNFPLAFSVAGGDTASALAAGCPVIVKGHPAHPGTSELVGRALQAAVARCGMPEGTFSMVQGQSHAIGAALVGHSAVKAVGFTGSFRGGKSLFDVAKAREEPIPVYAEMGSTNPVFLLPEALQERGKEIACGLADSATLGAGQFCTNPGLIFTMTGDSAERFIRAAAEETANRPSATMLHAGIRAAYESGIGEALSIREVHLVAAAQEASADGACAGVPRLLTTTVSTFLDNPRLEEEIFGPSSLVVQCGTFAEMLQAADALRGHLTATIHCADGELESYRDLVTTLERKAGRLVFNGFPTGVEVCHAMIHGGPYPATTDSRTTSVGTTAVRRFQRPVCFQNAVSSILPEALSDVNSLGIWRLLNSTMTRADVPH
jgi:NADP-dependent aldehyde dehydrogenase